LKFDDFDTEQDSVDRFAKLSKLSKKQKLEILKEESPEMFDLMEDLKECHIQAKEFGALLDM
jgi:predicted GIY-YIG superfamily endonuclease